MVDDYADTWLRLKKLMATYEACAELNQWTIAQDAAAEARLLATDLFLYAQARAEALRLQARDHD